MILLWILLFPVIAGHLSIWPGMYHVNLSLVAISAVISLTLFAAVCIATLFGIGIRALMPGALASARCPHCETVVAKSSVDRMCEHCGQALAAWLLIPEEKRRIE
jgi:hypothetical protein